MAKIDAMLAEYRELVEYAKDVPEFVPDAPHGAEAWVRAKLKEVEPAARFDYHDDGKGSVSVKALTCKLDSLKFVERRINFIYNEHSAALAAKCRAKLEEPVERIERKTEAPKEAPCEEMQPGAADEQENVSVASSEPESPTESVTDALAAVVSLQASDSASPAESASPGGEAPSVVSPDIELSEDEQAWLRSKSLDYHEMLASMSVDDQIAQIAMDFELETMSSSPAEAAADTETSTASSAADAGGKECSTQTEASSETTELAQIQTPSQEEIRRMMIADGLISADADENMVTNRVGEMLSNFDDDCARWVVRKERENQSLINDLFDQFVALAYAPLKRIERLRELFSGALREYTVSRLPRYERNTKNHQAGDYKHKYLDLPEGRISVRGSGGWKVVNEGAVREWLVSQIGDLVEEIDPEFVEEYGIKVRIDFSKTKVKAAAANGESIPGVEWSPEYVDSKVLIGVAGKPAWSFNALKTSLGKKLKLMEIKGENDDAIDVEATYPEE